MTADQLLILARHLVKTHVIYPVQDRATNDGSPSVIWFRCGECDRWGARRENIPHKQGCRYAEFMRETEREK